MKKRFLFDVDAEQVIVRQDKKKGMVHISVGTGFVSASPDNARELAETLLLMADNIDFDDVSTEEIEDEDDFREEDIEELEDFSFDYEV